MGEQKKALSVQKNLADIAKIYTGSSGGLYFKGVILKVEILLRHAKDLI